MDPYLSTLEEDNLEDVRDAQGSSQGLRILIVSTPKTGNTWLKNLLSHIYELPIVQIGTTFKLVEMEALGPRWVAHQHYASQGDLIAWGERRDVKFVTTVRHPGDILVSMFHHVRKFADRSGPSGRPASAMLPDGDSMGEHTASFVRDTFHKSLDISLGWMRSGKTRVVRYEDLWRDPLPALRELTASIREASLDRIERAVELCDFDLMRAVDADPEFFRKGQVGNWKRALPEDIVRILRDTEPYPDQFAKLGYTLQPDDPLTTLPRAPRVSKNPFCDITHFDNGVPVPPVAIRCYLSLDAAERGRWENLEVTQEDSFYSWLNAPAEEDPRRGEEVSTVTNLANYVHRTRPDLQKAFPDPFRRDRFRFVRWFIHNAEQRYELDEAFIEPLRGGLRVSQTFQEGGNILASILHSIYRKLGLLRSSIMESR